MWASSETDSPCYHCKIQSSKDLRAFRIRDKPFKVFDPSSPPKRGYKTYYYVEDGFMINTYKGQMIGLVYIAAQKDIYLCPEYCEDPKAFVEVGLIPWVKKTDLGFLVGFK